MSLLEAMDRRISVRTYSDKVPERELFERIQRVIQKERKGPFGNRYKMTFMDINSEESLDLGKMTSYGMIKNGRYFFGGYCGGDDREIIDYGYCFEEVVLELSELELDTCWLGGTFGRGFISKMLSLPEGKVIPAISPVGYGRDKRSVVDTMSRLITGSRKRKAFSKLFFNQAGTRILEPVFSEDLRAPLNDVLEAVRFAPSASNKQPWRIVIHDDLYHFYCDFDKTYNALAKGFNIQSLDMGIALCHFTQAAEELRFRGTLSYSDPKFENIKWNYILSWKVLRK